MLKKLLSLGILFVLTFTATSSILFAQSSKQNFPNNLNFLNFPSEVEIEFSNPVTLPEVELISDQYGIQPKILRFEIGGEWGEPVHGEYTITNGQTWESVIADLKIKHESSLKEGINALSDQIKTEKQHVVFSETQNLKRQFSHLLEEFKEEGLKIKAIRLEYNPSLGEMLKDSRVNNIFYYTPRNKGEGNLSLIENTVEFSSRENWAPNRGSSKVNKSLTFQVFYFNSVGAFGSTSTYEHETQVYNTNFANYAYYWTSNLPSAYRDTQFLDLNGIDNFAIGTSRASSLKANYQYYTSMSLIGQSAQTATVRIKGQKGHRSPSWCDSTWCVVADATTGSLITFTAPVSNQKSWTY